MFGTFLLKYIIFLSKHLLWLEYFSLRFYIDNLKPKRQSWHFFTFCRKLRHSKPR